MSRSASAWAAWGSPGGAGALAGWLLGAVAADLVLTRTLVRLAIFVPKGPEAAPFASLIGGLGAFLDALVVILALALLAALLLAAGRSPAPLAWRLGLALAAGVAAGGAALLLVPPVPSGVLLGDLLALAALGALAAPALRALAGHDPGLEAGRALAGLAFLGVAAAGVLATLAHAVDAGGALASELGAPSLSIGLRAVGELAYLAGATAVGLAGLLETARGRATVRRPWLVVAAVVALLVLGASLKAPVSLGILMMWSLGLSGTLPAPIYAAVAALAIAGGAALAGPRREVAVGLAIALLAGYALAASGLVLAALLGVALAVPGIAVAAGPAETVAPAAGQNSRERAARPAGPAREASP